MNASSYMSPPKLSLSLEVEEKSLPSVTKDAIKQKGITAVLYKTLSPRKKFDKFGLDQTDYKAYCLSSTVYPTAVKTTLIGDLQDSNPQLCGFDIVDRPSLGDRDTTVSLRSCATSVLHAPPPTAVTSHRSAHSAPIVAFVHIPTQDNNMPCTRGTSIASKSNAPSQVASETAGEQQHYDGVKGREDNSEGGGTFARNSITSTKGSDNAMTFRMEQNFQKRFQLPVQTSSSQKALPTMAPCVASYSRFEEARLTRYYWKTKEVRMEEDKQTRGGGDVRDTMYLNTFCPEERPVRFHKISLPRISRTPRQRPWTVSESNVSARNAALTASRNGNLAGPNRGFTQNYRRAPLKGVLKKSGMSAVSKSAGHISLRRQHGWADCADVSGGNGNDNDNDDDDDDDKENDDGDSSDQKRRRRPLLEIRSFLSSSAVEDQRAKLKGENGCLNSRVKQCVRFVRYRERLDKQDDNRPMKSEHGKYRPFSKTDVRDHSISNPAPTPELKLQQSVETYQHYVDTIARQTNIASTTKNALFPSSSSSPAFRGASVTASGFSRMRVPKMASSCSNFESDAAIVQTVLDSNRPEDQLRSSNGNDTPCPQHSAIYTKDVSAVGQALDIKRISPVPTVNRVVPGTRGVVQIAATPRVDLASSEEPDRGLTMEGAPLSPTSAHHGDAIVVPMVPKSECPSEYSVSKED